MQMTASLVEDDAPLAKDRRFVENIVSKTKQDGYASSVDGSEQGISAIALPIQAGGPVHGSLNLIFFTSSMTPDVAAKIPDEHETGGERHRRPVVRRKQSTG